jgi:large subunit ribosomal protein L25
MDTLEVEALPEHLPHRIEIDLSVLAEIDQAIHVKDIKLGEDVSIVSDPENVITRAVETKAEVEVAEAPAEEIVAEEGAVEKAEEEGTKQTEKAE